MKSIVFGSDRRYHFSSHILLFLTLQLWSDAWRTWICPWLRPWWAQALQIRAEPYWNLLKSFDEYPALVWFEPNKYYHVPDQRNASLPELDTRQKHYWELQRRTQKICTICILAGTCLILLSASWKRILEVKINLSPKTLQILYFSHF